MREIWVQLVVNGQVRQESVERLGSRDGRLSLVQEASGAHGLQCGFCTPGFIASVTAFLRDNPRPRDEQLREALSGNLCRCTGYQGILEAVRQVADRAVTS